MTKAAIAIVVLMLLPASAGFVASHAVATIILCLTTEQP